MSTLQIADDAIHADGLFAAADDETRNAVVELLDARGSSVIRRHTGVTPAPERKKRHRRAAR